MSESAWIVRQDGDRISAADPDGSVRSVVLADLHRVAIETNDSGPLAADVWWLLFGADDHVACAFPQGATGEQALIDRLMDLPGFDHQTMIAAMGSIENAVFPVWRRV